MSNIRYFLFELRWFWHNRTWKPTRQKFKQFEKDLAAYEKNGVLPWRAYA